MKQPFLYALLMGLLIAALAIATAWHAWQINLNTYGVAFLIPSALAGLFVGTLIWWFFIIKKSNFSIKRGLIIGGIIGLLIHPVAWYFNLIRQHINYYIFNICPDCPPNIDLWYGIFSSICLSYYSWYFFGLVTISIASLIGGLLAFWQKKSVHD